MNADHRMALLGAALLGFVVIGVMACAAPVPSGGDAPRPAGTPDAPQPPGGETTDPSTGAATAPTGPQELGSLASAIETLLSHRFPDLYAGVALDQAGNQVIVYRRPSAELDAALRERFGTAAIKLRDAPHSARELQAIARRVTDDVAYWARHGIPITTVAARFDGTAVEVGTTEVAKAARDLPKRYGKAPLRIVKEEPPTLLTPSAG
ncbi:hypothetical protein DQ384_11950 [Sphaerisporangium album]|uniref:Uncharacterized protein n=1 Tax=Sphaerisporangium album TaxID=509200 RepID=A0A367FNJ9_9ACTN|nr:hypothetical protein [Sphaerisporangium album]RCG31412.1 hypothetical protein DQ384_11950 [Sphaerisporangium album]